MQNVIYKIKDAFEKMKGGESIKIIKLENTSNNEEEWTGDWGRDSDNWGANNMAYDKLPPGTFYMPFEEYLRLFIGTDILLDC